MFRLPAVLLLAFVMPALAAQHEALDPVFDEAHFDRWSGGQDDAGFRIKAHVSRAELSFQQRLLASIEITLDGADFQTRRAGTLLLMAQVKDRDGNRYQQHTTLELDKLDQNVKSTNLEISQGAYFLPGDYELTVGILDEATHEHSTKSSKFRIAAPSSRFLRDAWDQLPEVEFIDSKQPSPDSWFLPDTQSRLRWADSVHNPDRLNVLLNVASPAPASGLSALLPTLKILSQTGSSAVSEDVDVLELSRRRDVFSQTNVKTLDWPRLRSSLTDANPASIDVRSLSERDRNAQFFVSEVRKVLRTSAKPGVLVVLTTPVTFQSGVDLEPISLEDLPPVHVFYVRYEAPPQFERPMFRRMQDRGRGGRLGDEGPTMQRRSLGVIDQLEPTLKPLHPRVFDVHTPEEMTKVLEDVRSALLNPD